jgi:hypothetical protein
MAAKKSNSQMSTRQEELLESIDAKLGGILVLLLDGYLRETGIAKPKPRNIDRMLSDAGVSNAEIAALLGKTERAVRLQLAEGEKKTAKVRGGGG